MLTSVAMHHLLGFSLEFLEVVDKGLEQLGGTAQFGEINIGIVPRELFGIAMETGGQVRRTRSAIQHLHQSIEKLLEFLLFLDQVLLQKNGHVYPQRKEMR